MSSNDDLTIHQFHLVGVAELRKRSNWFLVLGIVLVVLGMIAISSSVFFTLVTMVFIGWLMVVGGALQTAHAFTSQAWGGFFVDLMAGLFYLVVGLLIIGHPAALASALTLMIAMLLIIGGVFRLGVAIAIRFPNSVWLFIHGVINLLLGAMILAGWPDKDLWVIGTFMGIDMIFNGWTIVMLAIAAKSLPRPPVE